MYHVLIADDEPLMRQALEVMISKVDGFEVTYSVGNGELAAEICKRNKVDIVFMDIIMPGESGIECSKKIYEENPKTTIFIVSSYSSFEFAIEALKTKVKAYISKPVSFLQIETLLKNYLTENTNIYNESRFNKNEELFSIIKEKDFKKVYYDIPKIVKKIYIENKDNRESLKEYFIDLGQNLINSISLLYGEEKKVQELFPVDEFLIKDEKFFEFWIFKVINYIFKENSIKKYELLENVFDYIENHIEQEIGLNEIINNCSVSQGYLSRIFKREFNVSVMEYLHMRKMYMAKSYFCFTDLKITDVAFRLGYNESSYFSKVFKKYENTTVYQYKKALQ
ncbi:response regulator [Clostridium sp. SHJSY1]|uniref:response regulator n=1 Tax=Clostridium sp. SHJSY1 TaxID=2942483 RepID=UPI002875A9BD|nr:response regulator [Clostridium sp. SHJSY1]MDS0528248.1 response regulator [Clostridium sp. SHJSY1]